MKVEFPGTPTSVNLSRQQPRPEPTNSFQEHLPEALREVDQLQHQSDVALSKLLTGEIEFHDAMITVEKANFALHLTIAIRTKLIEAYQDIIRMEV